MNNPKYINNIDLEYLSISKFQKNELNTKNVSPDELEFYYKRIIQTTKDLCRNKIHNTELKNIFNEYLYSILYYLKREDEQELYQQEYDNLKFKQDKSESGEINIDNQILFNNNKNSNLNKFVITKPNINEKKIVPLKKNVNLKEERFRTKGLVKKN